VWFESVCGSRVCVVRELRSFRRVQKQFDKVGSAILLPNLDTSDDT